MTTQWMQLCSLVVGEVFGASVRSVADALLHKGPLTLRVILAKVNLSAKVVQQALKTLIQHRIVRFVSTKGSGEALYTILFENVVELTRYSSYLECVEKGLGATCRDMLEEIMQAGVISVSKLVFIGGHRLLKVKPDLGEKALFDQLTKFYNALHQLAEKKFIIIVPPPRDDDEEEEEKDSEGFDVPNVNVSGIATKLLGKKKKGVELKLETLPDADILWGVNVLQFHVEIRNRIVYEAMEKKFETMMDPRIIKILIEFGFEKHPWENEGSPISYPQIKDRIQKMGNSATTCKYMDEHLEILEDDATGIVTRLNNMQGGYFSFNMKTAIKNILWGTVDRILAEKHGYQALRIFRLVKENGYVEQDFITDRGMIPGKDAKNLMYQLVAEHFINIKEVRKTYTAAASTGKANHVFYINPHQVIRTLQEICYKAILNVKLKAKVETDKIKRLTVKEERITRILANMASKECTDDQINEIRDLITPPERALILRSHSNTKRLLNGALQIDETLFITELYLKYHFAAPTPIPTKSSKK